MCVNLLKASTAAAESFLCPWQEQAQIVAVHTCCHMDMSMGTALSAGKRCVPAYVNMCHTFDIVSWHLICVYSLIACVVQ